MSGVFLSASSTWLGMELRGGTGNGTASKDVDDSLSVVAGGDGGRDCARLLSASSPGLGLSISYNSEVRRFMIKYGGAQSRPTNRFLNSAGSRAME